MDLGINNSRVILWVTTDSEDNDLQ